MRTNTDLRFLSIESTDAAGKTTLINWLVPYLTSLGLNVVKTREPGGTDIAEKLRAIALETSSDNLPAFSELMIMAAARVHHLETLIKPSVEAGKIVVTDRFTDSTYAYQGAGRGIKGRVEAVEKLHRHLPNPRFTLYLRVSSEVAEGRIKARKSQSEEYNRFDAEKELFKQRVRLGYENRVRNDLDRFYIVDADKSVDEVRAQVKSWIDEVYYPALKLEALKQGLFFLHTAHPL